MSVGTQENITQKFLTDLTVVSPKATFMPFDKIASALKYLEENGIPNNKHEDYKYCNVEGIIRREFKSLTKFFSPVKKETLQKFRANKSSIYFFVVNGELDKQNSDFDQLPKGLTIISLSDTNPSHKEITGKHFGAYANENSDALVALNTVFCGNGIFVHIQKNAVIEKCIEIIYVDSAKENTAINFRKLFVAEENSQCNIIERYETLDLHGKLFSNHLTEFYLGEHAAAEISLLQEGCENFFGVNTLQVFQQAKSNFTIHTFTFGGTLVRNNLNIVVSGEHAETHLNGLCVASGNQLVDNHTIVDHTVPNCESNELYKGIADGKSTVVFNGKIFVRRDAQKTNAYQSSKNILLSDDATVNTKPQLEIFADDVKCSHGTSTGKVDEEALFYLKARGIGETNARKLLLAAFAGEVIEKVKNEELRNMLEEKFHKSLN